MARLVIVIDTDHDPRLWDPEEAAEDILAHADGLPTFGPGVPWFLRDPFDSTSQIAEGTFVSASWAS